MSNILENSLLIRTIRGNRPSTTPIWLMRQAGRFLPEYRELRARHSMLELIRTPRLACQVTLQPINRFEFDAAIIFADILTPLIGMGIKLDFVEGEGPKIFNPVEDPSDVTPLIIPSPSENVGYTLEAINLVASELNKRNIPTIGFAGAPFTLSCYILADRKIQSADRVKKFMFCHPSAWEDLQTKLATMTAEYLISQVNAGASMVQLFDSWAGALGAVEYDLFALPYLKKIVSMVRSKTSAPITYFSTGTSGIIEKIKEIGADAIGVDWRTNLSRASSILGKDICIQGNLDPAILLGSKEYLEKEVKRIIKEAAQLPTHIFNLGHGVLPDTPIENVEHLIKLVRSSAIR